MLYAYAYLLPVYVKLMWEGLHYVLGDFDRPKVSVYDWIRLRIFRGYIPFFLGIGILYGIERFFS